MNLINPICVALDTPDLARAIDLAHALKGTAGMVKLGMEFFYAHGPKAYEDVARQGVPVFLDLKLHDIPNTVAQGLTSLLRLSPPPAILNIHASGGRPMMEAAAKAVAGKTKLIAVTILTSLANEDIHEAGFDKAMPTDAHARNLAQLAKSSGLDGVVCSPLDVAGIKAECGPDFLTIVPGIRPQDAAIGDQKRIATPQSARASGADILVIGRPITGAKDPIAACAQIVESLQA